VQVDIEGVHAGLEGMHMGVGGTRMGVMRVHVSAVGVDMDVGHESDVEVERH
jgi:hypothetical protein